MSEGEKSKELGLDGLSKSRWRLVHAPTANHIGWSEWDELNLALNAGSPILDSKFLRPICNYYGFPDLRVAVLESGGQPLSAMLLHQRRRGDWQVFTAGQSCVASMLISPKLSQHSMEAVIEQLLRQLPWAWRIRFPKQDPILAQLATEPQSSHLRHAIHSVTTNIDVSADFDSYWSARHKEVRRGIRKTLSTLAEREVDVKLHTLSERSDMTKAIADHGKLETAGWKGRAGTAIDPENDQGRCYREILENFSANGARVYQLFFDQSVVASLLSVVQNGVQVILKTAYDENYSKYSPGRLIDYLSIAETFEDPEIKMLENYTNSSSVDRKWSTGTRNILNLEYYKFSSLPKMVAGFGWIKSKVRDK